MAAERRGAWREFVAAVRADHATIARYSDRYRGAGRASKYLTADFVQKVGFQMIVVYRLMRLARAARIPLLPQILSRFIRHLYATDIHWNASFEPGVMIVHGMGMCISHGATVASGAILFQRITLGEGIDAATREVGSPRIERDVHIGPGATLLGPITIGAGSKIMAGCTVTHSIPAGCLVEAPAPAVRRRGDGPLRAAAS